MFNQSVRIMGSLNKVVGRINELQIVYIVSWLQLQDCTLCNEKVRFVFKRLPKNYPICWWCNSHRVQRRRFCWLQEGIHAIQYTQYNTYIHTYITMFLEAWCPLEARGDKKRRMSQIGSRNAKGPETQEPAICSFNLINAHAMIHQTFIICTHTHHIIDRSSIHITNQSTRSQFRSWSASTSLLLVWLRSNRSISYLVHENLLIHRPIDWFDNTPTFQGSQASIGNYKRRTLSIETVLLLRQFQVFIPYTIVPNSED
jgi:hypothetical protein